MSRAQDLGVDRMRSHASRLPTSYLVVERIHALAQESPSLGLSDANSKSRIDVEEILSHLERLHNRAISSGLFGVSAVLLQAASSIRDLSPSSARGTHSEALDTALSSPVDSCASEIVQPDGAKSVDDPVQSPSGEPDLGHDIDDGFMDQGGSPSMSSPNFYVIPHDRNTSTPNEWLHHPSEIDDGQLQELVHLAIGLTPSLEATRDDSTTTHTTVNPSVFASAANGDTGAAKATRHNAKAASKLPRLVKGGYFGTRRRATGKRGSQGTQSRNSAQALNSNGDVVATSSTSVRTPSAIRDRKITNGGELTVSKMLRILQEFDRKASEPAAAESTTAESTTADSTTTESTPANRMQGFSKGLYDAIEDLPKYLARLLVAVRESSYVSDVDSGYHTVTQGKDRIDYCLVLLERLQRHAARNDVRGLEELCMLHELGAEFESLVKELADDGKAVRDWAKKKRMITETGYSGSIKAICRAYLVEYLVEESRKCTTKFPKDSIGDRLTAAHKLRVLTERLGAGFLLLLARHKNIVGSVYAPYNLTLCD
ncbi:hypothetical protein ANO11243_056180 [Dothideomycetidae sp. 11243]|nr:hypothetical protein ANO11243_056180 [fungal sp. No.11243]